MPVETVEQVKQNKSQYSQLNKALIKEAIVGMETAYYGIAASSVKVSNIKIEGESVTADVIVCLGRDDKREFDSNVYTASRVVEKIVEAHGASVLPQSKVAAAKKIAFIPCGECTRQHLEKDSPKGAPICGVDKQLLGGGHVCPLDSRPRLKKIVIQEIKDYNEVDLTD